MQVRFADPNLALTEVGRGQSPSVEGVLDKVGGIAVREAEGLVNAGSKGGHTVCDGRTWAWGPQTTEAQPYAALLALFVPSVAEPSCPRHGAEVRARHEGGHESGQRPREGDPDAERDAPGPGSGAGARPSVGVVVIRTLILLLPPPLLPPRPPRGVGMKPTGGVGKVAGRRGHRSVAGFSLRLVAALSPTTRMPSDSAASAVPSASSVAPSSCVRWGCPARAELAAEGGEGVGTAASERTVGMPVTPSASRSSLSSLSAVWLPGVGLEARPEPTTAGAMSAAATCRVEADRYRLTDRLVGRRCAVWPEVSVTAHISGRTCDLPQTTPICPLMGFCVWPWTMTSTPAWIRGGIHAPRRRFAARR